MTLNAVIALILRFSRNSTDFQADYITVVEDRRIMSVKYCLPVPLFYFWRKLQRTLQRGLSAIAEHLSKILLLTQLIKTTYDVSMSTGGHLVFLSVVLEVIF